MTRVSPASTLCMEYSGSLYISEERRVALLYTISNDFEMVSQQYYGHSRVTTLDRVPHHRSGLLSVHIFNLYIRVPSKQLLQSDLFALMEEHFILYINPRGPKTNYTGLFYHTSLCAGRSNLFYCGGFGLITSSKTTFSSTRWKRRAIRLARSNPPVRNAQ